MSSTERHQKLPRLLHTVSKLVLFSVSGLKDEKLIKKQTYKKLKHGNSVVQPFEYFCQNLIKIDPYNFELYCFKVGAFLRHSIEAESDNFLTTSLMLVLI